MYDDLIYLIKKAQGNRSLNNFAKEVSVSAGHLSRIINSKFVTPPSPDILKRIALHADNNVSYDQLMLAAGYIYSEGTSINPTLKESKASYKKTSNLSIDDLINAIEKYFNDPSIDSKEKDYLLKKVTHMYLDSKVEM